MGWQCEQNPIFAHPGLSLKASCRRLDDGNCAGTTSLIIAVATSTPPIGGQESIVKSKDPLIWVQRHFSCEVQHDPKLGNRRWGSFPDGSEIHVVPGKGLAVKMVRGHQEVRWEEERGVDFPEGWWILKGLPAQPPDLWWDLQTQWKCDREGHSQPRTPRSRGAKRTNPGLHLGSPSVRNGSGESYPDPSETERKERGGKRQNIWTVRDIQTKERQDNVKSQMDVNFYRGSESERLGEREGCGKGRREGKTAATKLCRGFNQPNYSLITETPNVEQLTGTYTHRHTSLRAHFSENISQMRWKLQCQTDYFNSFPKKKKFLNLNEKLQQWQNKRKCCFSNYGGGERFLSFPFPLARFGKIWAWKAA